MSNNLKAFIIVITGFIGVYLGFSLFVWFGDNGYEWVNSWIFWSSVFYWCFKGALQFVERKELDK